MPSCVATTLVKLKLLAFSSYPFLGNIVILTVEFNFVPGASLTVIILEVYFSVSCGDNSNVKFVFDTAATDEILTELLIP